MKLPFNIDLSGKVCVVTGAGGVLCSLFAKALASTGAKVALLDLNVDAANAFAKEICDDGGIAKGYMCNVLETESIPPSLYSESLSNEQSSAFGKLSISSV